MLFLSDSCDCMLYTSNRLRFYRDFLGMKLLVREDVSDYGFFLYFLAFTDDKPPSSNIDAVENREWLYQRQYTVLELQVFQDGSQHKFVPLNKDSFGFMVSLRSWSPRFLTNSRSGFRA